MIKVLGAFDKFKDSLPADEVGKACLGALEKQYPGKVQTKLIAMSDGGEGFLNALKIPLNLTVHKKTVTGMYCLLVDPDIKFN